jgi:hypothetical protein
MLSSALTLSVLVLFLGQSLFVGSGAIQTQQGQTREFERKCPVISVSCPSEVKDGELLTFTAHVRGGDPKVVPVYRWEVWAGRIIQGQGSASIKLDLTGSPTATVTVTGFDSDCAATASCSLIIEHWDLNPKKFDSYSALPHKEALKRLNAFAVQLENQPGAQAYLLAYGGQRGRAGEALGLAAQVKEYLVKSHRIDAVRIVTLDGGYREKPTIDLWIVGIGGNLPVATPTIDPSEVKIIPTVKRKRSKH